MKVFACYSVFNEARHLQESIRSIISAVDRVILVDGLVQTLYDDHHCSARTDDKIVFLSTDDSKKIAEAFSYKIHWFSPKAIWRNEMIKRNAIFALANGHPGDYYLVIDGDEVAAGDVKAGILEVAETGLCGTVIQRTLSGPTRRETWKGKNLRIIPHHPGIHYCMNHVTIRDGEDRQFATGHVHTGKFELLNLHDEDP